MAILQELRFVTHEVGLHEARRMPTEVRRWWIEEMQKERQTRTDEVEQLAGGKKRVADVPRGRR
jgi:hypothetical protein